VTTLADLPDLAPIVAEHDYPVLFATVSGAHLYGFPSRDSDIDLRGVHILPVVDIVGLRAPTETIGRMWMRDGVEMDLVTHDLRKFTRLLLRPNGYVLEQLLSPLIVHTTPWHAELADLVPGMITAGHAGHYLGFAATQWRLFGKSGDLKPLLYTFRVLMSGIHLMGSHEVCAHLPTLIDRLGAPTYLRDLITAKACAEHQRLDQITGVPDHDRLQRDVEALIQQLADARDRSGLPERPSVAGAVEDLVVQARLEDGASLGMGW